MDDLIEEYKQTLKGIRKAKERAKDKAGREIISEMESDLLFALQWMKTGRMPGSYIGVERKYPTEREMKEYWG